MESQINGVERRGFLGWLLATSAGTLLLSVLYPVIRFISPPHIPEATTSQVEAGPTNDPELLEKGIQDHPVRSRAGDLNPTGRVGFQGIQRDLHPSRLHRGVPEGQGTNLVQLPQRALRHDGPQRRRASPTTPHRLQGRRRLPGIG